MRSRKKAMKMAMRESMAEKMLKTRTTELRASSMSDFKKTVESNPLKVFLTVFAMMALC